MLDPLIIKAIALGLGLLFFVAAYQKATQQKLFRATLHDYQLVPESLLPVVARLIPVAEALLGAGWLLADFMRLTEIVSVASATLLVLYGVAISINLQRGRRHIDCGCSFGGGNDQQQFLSASLVARNLVLAAVSLAALVPVTARTLAPGDYLTLIATLCAAVLLFTAANQLITNRASINTWRKRT